MTQKRLPVLTDAEIEIFNIAAAQGLEGKDVTTPPGSPADTDAYIVGAGATGAWAGQDLKLAVWYATPGVWEFCPIGPIGPTQKGMVVEDNTTHNVWRFMGSAWALSGGPPNSAADILTKLLTVDGAGSGLDADYLDGHDSSYFAPVSALAGYQPLDSDLTAIALLTPANDDVIQRKGGVWTNRTMAQLAADLGGGVGGGSYQPLDADLTTIAALVATTDNFIQSKASAWASRTPAQVKVDLNLAGSNTGDETASTILTKLLTVDGTGSGLDADLLDGHDTAFFAAASALAGYQPLDTDLTTIAALTPTTDSFMQAKAGAWASRTIAQVKTDLGLTGTNSGDETAAGLLAKLLTVDGSGSGLDADLLDGQSSAAFEQVANKNVNNGYAGLDSSGKVAAAQLPSYVDDVLEFANLAAFPATGTAGIIYIALDTNKTYRWGGSAYTEISPSPGSTDAVPEGSTNLYFTARVLATVLTGLSTATNAAITAADTVLVAFGKLQAQFTAHNGSGGAAHALAVAGGAAGFMSGTDKTAINGLATAYQPLDADLTTIAALVATTDNFMQSKAGAWASRTIAQVKTDLGLTGTNSGDETGATLLAKLAPVDGTGSGLDADTLDGLDSLYFLPVASPAFTGTMTGPNATLTGAFTAASVVANAGSVAVDRRGDNTTASFQLLGDVATLRDFVVYTGANQRWTHRFADNVAEGGADAGSNMQLYRWNDAGTVATVVYQINRATGVMSFTVSPIAPTPTAGDSTTKLATTAFVSAAITAAGGGAVLSEIVLNTTGIGTDLLDLARHADLRSAAYVDVRDILDDAEPSFWGDGGTASGDIEIDGGLAAQVIFEAKLDGGTATWPQG
jgi:hypothetical protein